MAQIQSCPVCDYPGIPTLPHPDPGRDMQGFECPRCGKFFSSRSAIDDRMFAQGDYKLSAWIRNIYELGGKPPEFTTYNLPEVRSNLPHLRVSDTQIRLLRAVERKTTHPGEQVRLNIETDYPLAWARNQREFTFIIEVLIERRLLYHAAGPLGNAPPVKITADGWDFLDSVPVETFSQAFVAMSFADEMDPIWEHGIRPAIQRAGYEPLRVDKVEHIDRIDAKIIADIKDSRFLVADVTKQNHGVYFEAGYAIGLGRPVLWSVRSDDLKNAHFDTSHYNHIVWDAPEDLHEKLYNRIRAVIG